MTFVNRRCKFCKRLLTYNSETICLNCLDVRSNFEEFIKSDANERWALRQIKARNEALRDTATKEGQPMRNS